MIGNLLFIDFNVVHVYCKWDRPDSGNNTVNTDVLIKGRAPQQIQHTVEQGFYSRHLQTDFYPVYLHSTFYSYPPQCTNTQVHH